MLDSKNLVELIKQISSETEETASPCSFCYGKVISAAPLKILVEQKLTLSEMQLVLTRNVTDFEMEITPLSWKTEKPKKLNEDDTKDDTIPDHFHDIKEERKKIKVHSALKAGETVVLIRQRGGQKYLVLDRVVSR